LTTFIDHRHEELPIAHPKSPRLLGKT